MIYGVEQNTDMRHPDTRVYRFTSVRRALAWQNNMNRGGEGVFAFPGAASDGLPVSQQNWHRRFRYLFESPPGWRPPSDARAAEAARRASTPTYPRTRLDATAAAIMRECDEITPDDGDGA